MVIHVDSHERKIKHFQNEIPRILERFGVPIKKLLLDVGDYVIIGDEISVCCELKTVEDYVSSIQNNQLSTELYQMSASYDYNVLLIHGNLDDALMHRKLKRSSLFEFLAGCTIEVAPLGKQSKISVITVNTVHDAVAFLRTLHKKVVSGDFYREPTVHKVKLPPSKKLVFTTKFMFPPECHIGAKRAEQLLIHFGSIKNIVNATKDRIMAIPGFGEEISKGIIEHLNRSYKKGGAGKNRRIFDP